MNYTQEQMAELLRISRNFYNQIENGRRNPNYDTTVRICNLTNLDVREWH